MISARSIYFLVVACALGALPARGAHADGPAVPALHRFSFPSRTTPGSLVAAVEGRHPDEGHPGGTALVVWSRLGRGIAIGEVDLAQARMVRQVDLGWAESDVRAARSGASLHVVGDSHRALTYARVDAATLRTVCQVDLARSALPAGVASDGATTVVAWIDLGFPRQVHVDLVDASCGRHPVLTRIDPYAAAGHDRVAVLDGRAFVLLGGSPRAALVAMAPDASISKEIAVDLPDSAPALAATASRLLVAGSGEILELSAQLDVLARHPFAAGPTELLAVASDGRVLAAFGSVNLGRATVGSPSFVAGIQLDAARPWCHQALWVGRIPVVVSTASEPSSVAWMDWSDP